MKAKLFILSVLIGLSIKVFSQKQVTYFENDSTKSPNNFKFLGKTDKNFFFTAFTPEQGNEIWVSDGTESGTHLLKDIEEGENSLNLYSFLTKENMAFFCNYEKVWKTDGTSENTSILKHVEYDKYGSVLQIIKYENDIYLITQKNEDSSWLISFYKLDEKGNILLWKNNISSFKIIGDQLIYVLFDAKNKQSTLMYRKDNIEQIITTYQSDYSFSEGKYSISQQKDNFYILINEKLYRIDKHRQVRIDNWGNHRNTVPLYATNERNEDFLIKANSYQTKDSIFIYAAENYELRYKAETNGINQSYNFTGGDKFYSNTIFEKEKLIYVDGFKTEGARITYFNSIDFNKKSFLRNYIVLNDSNLPIPLSITKLAENKYLIKSQYVAVEFNEDTETFSKQRPNISPPQIFSFNTKNYEIANNIYELIGTKKLPIIKNLRKIYALQSGISKFRVGNQYYFALYSYANSQSEIWRLDSTRTEKVVEIEGQVYNIFNFNDAPNRVYVSLYHENIFKVYEIISDSYQSIFEDSAKNAINTDFHLQSDYMYYKISKNTYRFYSPTNSFNVQFNKGYIRRLENSYFVVKDSSDYFNYYYLIKNGKLLAIPQMVERYDEITASSGYVYFRGKDKNVYQFNINQPTVTPELIVKEAELSFHFEQYIVTQKYTDKTNRLDLVDYEIYSIPENKLITKILRAKHCKILYSSGYLFFYSPEKFYIFDRTKIVELALPDQMREYSNYKVVKDGVIFTSINTVLNKQILYFVNLKTLSIVKIFESNSQYDSVSAGSLNNSDFILIQDSKGIFYSWSILNNSISKITLLPNEYILSEQKRQNVIKTDKGYLVFENDQVIRKELLIKYIEEVNLDNVFEIRAEYSPVIESALYAIGKGFKVEFNPIANVGERITVSEHFLYNQKLYAILFTYTHGWQVWEMGTSKIVLASENESSTLNVYPNPAQSILTIDTNEPFNYQIVDILGRILVNGDLQDSKQITIEHLPEGNYILQLYNTRNVFTKKIIKVSSIR